MRDLQGFAALPRKQNIVDTNIKIDDCGKSLNGGLPPTTAIVSRTTPNGVTLVDASTSPIKSCDCTVTFTNFIHFKFSSHIHFCRPSQDNQ